MLKFVLLKQPNSSNTNLVGTIWTKDKIFKDAIRMKRENSNPSHYFMFDPSGKFIENFQSWFQQI